MWKVTNAITSMEMLPDISAHDNSHLRKERRISLYLPQEVVEKLQKSRNNPTSSPHYSLRLFCTSSDHYKPQYMGQPTSALSNRAIPIEYPTNPDISIDGMHIHFRERGLRGKPGSAPPIDLMRTHAQMVLASSRQVLVVMGHTGPTTGKRKDQAKVSRLGRCSGWVLISAVLLSSVSG